MIFYIFIMDFSPVSLVYDFLKSKCFGIPFTCFVVILFLINEPDIS